MTTIRQFLGKKRYINDYMSIDGWSYLHLAIFFYIGIILPNRWALIIGITVAFEVAERIISRRVDFFKETDKDTLSDFVINLIGYYAGQFYLLNFGGF